jgi:hypothetical protein
MAISITSTPAKTRLGYSSKWVACNNPVLFTFTSSGSPADEFIQVALYEADGTTQIVELKRIPIPLSDEVVVDFQAFLQSEVSNSDDSLITSSNIENDAPNQYKVFRVGYRTTTAGAYTVDSTEYIAINAVRQAGSEFGQNMADYLYSIDFASPASLTFSGKFLTEFDTMPLFWYSPVLNPSVSEVTYFYFTLAFMLTDEVVTNETGFTVSTYFKDSTGTTQKTVTKLNNFASPPAQSLQFINYGSGASNNAYSFNELGVEIETNSTLFKIIEEFTIKPIRVCNNPTAIKWKNDLGGWDLWVFEGNSPVSVGIETSDVYTVPYGDLQSLTQINRSYQKRRTPLKSVSADSLTLNEVKALSKMLSSPNVLYCTDDLSVAGTTASTWVSVNVLDGDFQLFDRRLNTYRLELEFELLEEFTISN